MLSTLNPLDPHALQEGKNLRLALPMLAPRQAVNYLIIHWEVEAYGENDRHYNVPISLQDGVWRAVIAVDPRLNASSPPQGGYAAHTAGRNSHAVAVALSGMLGASPSDFGEYPIQEHQLEVACAAVAAICLKYGIDTSSSDYPDLVMTHAEAAIADKYFPGDVAVEGYPQSGPPYRWDLARLEASSEPLSKAEAISTGNRLRSRIHAYKSGLISA